MKGEITYLTGSEAWEFLKDKHYAGRRPSISKAFGWVINGETVAVVTFGKPASPSLCFGICGEKHRSNVYELNRLCRIDGLEEQLSQFVSACLRRLRAENWIIVSYSDSGMHHNGYIYQACNFIFTGKTKERTDKYTEDGKHSRHYKNDQQKGLRVVRTSKNRYVFFATKNKALKKEWESDMNYPVLPYPKEVNQNYILGDIQKRVVITGGEHG
jgi:hypothetical protein